MYYCTEITPVCPVEWSIYGYYPSLGANAFFTAWFAILIFPNFYFGIRYKAWTYMLALSLGCITETIGYIGRILLHDNPYSETGFQMQICCLILGPAFNSAAIYLTLKHIALFFGPEYSIMKPRWYTYVFITGDIIALVLQAIGGGIAATAGDNLDQAETGTNIMMAGISWQVATLLLFAATSTHYLYRRFNARRNGHDLSPEATAALKDLKFRLFAIAVFTAFLAIFARCVYRIVELYGGWANEVMRDEPSYIVLEGVVIAYASLVQTVFHPGYCFPPLCGRKEPATMEEERKEGPSPSES